MFVRVIDNDTQYEYDVDENDPRIGDSLTLVKGAEPSRLAREPVLDPKASPSKTKAATAAEGK